MQKEVILMYKRITILILVQLIILFSMSNTQAAVNAIEQNKLTLKVVDKPLSQLVSEIKKQKPCFVFMSCNFFTY